MGVVLRRVEHDASPPPSVYGAAGMEAPPLDSARWSDHVDVAVVGGGLTGLWTAYHLAAAGTQVAVLEKRHIGSGASGRAFGQVVPYLKHSAQTITHDFGEERGAALLHAVATAPADIAAFIERYQIACAATRTGILIGARTDAGRARLDAMAAAQEGDVMALLHGADAAAVVGSPFYRTVLLDRRGFHLNPLAYTRGLARAASSHGALLHSATAVDSMTRHGSRWELCSGERRMTADAVILATNAYAGALSPRLARSVVPFLVHGVVTEILPPDVLARVLPDGQPLTDTRRLYSGVRKFGRRLHVSIDGAAFTPGRADPQAAVSRRLAELYPWLPAPRVAERWSGWIALTRDQYPRLHALGDGLWAGTGCNGRGLAAASLIGRDLARLALGRRDTVFPVTPLRALPVHDAAAAVVAALLSANRWLDHRDASRGQ